MFNPFSYAVELIRFALYGQFEPFSALVVAGCALVFLAASILAYDPSAGIMARRGGPDAAK
jgi:ABC-2 type transport system permease protein